MNIYQVELWTHESVKEDWAVIATDEDDATHIFLDWLKDQEIDFQQLTKFRITELPMLTIKKPTSEPQTV